MPAHTAVFTVNTRGKGTHEITADVARVVRESGVANGTATVFIQHTSASLVIYENADPSARTDLHAFFERLVPEDAPEYIHTAEGSDDTTSHLRMVLTRTSEAVPIMDGRLALGTWQGIFVFEHRRAAHRRGSWCRWSGFESDDFFVTRFSGPAGGSAAMQSLNRVIL